MSGERKLRQRQKTVQDVCVGPALSPSISSNPSLNKSKDNIAQGVGCLQHGTASIAWYIMLFKFVHELFELVLGHIRSLARMVKQMVLWAVPKAPTSKSTSVGASEIMSTVLKESTIPLDLTLIKKIVRVVDSDSLRYDKEGGISTVALRLIEKAIQAETTKVKAENKKLQADIKKAQADIRKMEEQITNGCFTEDEYQNCNKWLLQLTQEIEAVQEKIRMDVRNIEKQCYQIISYVERKITFDQQISESWEKDGY